MSELRKIPYRLTDDELVLRQQEFSSFQIELEDIREEKKNVTAEYAERIKSLDERQRERRTVIKTRTEVREVMVEQQPNFTTGMMEYIDANGEVVETRRLTPQERQLEIPIRKVM